MDRVEREIPVPHSKAEAVRKRIRAVEAAGATNWGRLKNAVDDGFKDLGQALGEAIERSGKPYPGVVRKTPGSSDEDPASLPHIGRGVDRRVPRRELGMLFSRGRRPSMEDTPASDAVLRRFAFECAAHSHRSDDIPALPHYTHRRAVDEDLARGNGHPPRVRRTPQGEARYPHRKNQGRCKDGFHGVPPPCAFSVWMPGLRWGIPRATAW